MTVIELRQYTMVPELRDDFVNLFDREFVETQEAQGMEVLGQFRDSDRDDRYVWLRRFANMDARKASLEAFYGGPVWAEHKEAANPTMTEWHDVLLVRPAWQGSDLSLDAAVRPKDGFRNGGGETTIAVWAVDSGDMAAFGDRVRKAFPTMRAAYVTETSANTYPRLPIRESESVFVALFDGDVDLGKAGAAPAQVLRLAPTPRSRWRGA